MFVYDLSLLVLRIFDDLNLEVGVRVFLQPEKGCTVEVVIFRQVYLEGCGDVPYNGFVFRFPSGGTVAVAPSADADNDFVTSEYSLTIAIGHSGPDGQGFRFDANPVVDGFAVDIGMHGDDLRIVSFVIEETSIYQFASLDVLTTEEEAGGFVLWFHDLIKDIIPIIRNMIFAEIQITANIEFEETFRYSPYIISKINSIKKLIENMILI